MSYLVIPNEVFANDAMIWVAAVNENLNPAATATLDVRCGDALRQHPTGRPVNRASIIGTVHRRR